MLVGGDLVFFSRVAAAAFVVLLGPVIGFVVRLKWRRAVARREDINRLLVLASDEDDRVAFEAAAEYTSGHCYSYGSVLEEALRATAPTTLPVQITWQFPHQCALCFSPTSTRCSRCKSVRYCSGKCQIIHWRQGHKDECHPVFTSNRESNSDETNHSNFMQNANEIYANGVEDESAQSFLPTNVHAEPVLSKSSMSGISIGINAMEGNHLTDGESHSGDTNRLMLKQNAKESYANGIEDEGTQTSLPINMSAEPVLSKSSMTGISNGMDAMEGNHLTDRERHCEETNHSMFKQNANERFANGIEDECTQSSLPINMSAEPVLSTSSMSGISNAVDAMEGNHLTDERTLNSDSTFSLYSFFTSTASSKLFANLSVCDSDDSVKPQTCQPNMEQCKPPSLEQPALISSINALSTSSISIHIKPGAEDTNSSSSGSRISNLNGSTESSSATPYSSSSVVREGAVYHSKPKMHLVNDISYPSLKESVDLNISGSQLSLCHSSAITESTFPVVDEQSCQVQSMILDDTGSKISTVRKQNDTTGPLQIKDNMEFRRSSSLKPETPTQTDINHSIEKCTSNSKKTSHSSYTASHDFPVGGLVSNGTLKVNGLLRELNGGVEGINNFSLTTKALQVESLHAKAYYDRPSSSFETREFRSVKHREKDSTQQVTAFSSQYGNHSQSGKNALNLSGLKVSDQLKNLKLPHYNSLGGGFEIAGRYYSKGIFPYNLFLKLYSWSKVELHPFGLSNCGNSCYANAVLQCLAFTPPLTAYFLQGLHSKGCMREGWCFTCEFESLVLQVKEGKSPLSPFQIVSHLENIGSNLGNGQEEDAHEFLRHIIDTMQSVCLKEVGVTASGSVAEETTLIGHTFGGYLHSTIECMRCGGKSEKHERMMDLIVEIYGNVATLEEALKQFSRTEMLDGKNKYNCSRCKSYEKARKKMKVLEAPNVLTIALKRFQSGKFGKLNKPVTFPEILNLAPYMSGTSDKSPIYHLYGVIVHLDVMNAAFSGHYICYVKNIQNKWFRVDDSMVKAVKLESVLSEKAYILLYARCSPRATRFIKSLSIPHDTSCKSRSQPTLAGSWECSYFSHLKPRPFDDCLSDNSTSLFSEGGTSSVDSSHMDSMSVDEYFEISDHPSGYQSSSPRNSSDYDTSSSSSLSP